MPAAGGERIGWIDTAKGTAILLVVLGHAYLVARLMGNFPAWLATVNLVLFNIRMPLFFLASGLLMERLAARSWRQIMRKRVVPMAWVLLFWTMIGSAVDFYVRLYPWSGGELSGLAEALWLPQGNLWFVYTLLVFAVLARMVAIAHGWQRMAVAAFLWLALVGYDLWRGEFHTRNMVQYFPFFIAGMLAAEWIRQATSSWRGLAITFAVSLAGVVALLLLGVDGLAGKAGHNVFGTGLFIAAAAAIRPWPRVTRWLDAAGRNSLAIFLGHMPVLAIAFAVLPFERVDTVPAWLMLTALAVGGALLLERGARTLGLGWVYRAPERVTDWFDVQPGTTGRIGHG